MKVLIVGDVVGRPGRKTLYNYLEKYKNKYDFIIVNGENSASGFGITEKIAKEFFEKGVDVITSGNHIWDKKEIYEYIEQEPRLLRPYNYPEGVKGRGYIICDTAKGKIAVISMQGRVFMPASIDCPFVKAKELIEEIKNNVKYIIVDFHAEASSEKISLARYLSGEISALYGTHTHVQTADETIFEEGTGYITDVGMTGSFNGVIGNEAQAIINKFLTGLPQRFAIAEGNEKLNGIELDLAEEDGSCISIQRIIWENKQNNTETI